MAAGFFLNGPTVRDVSEVAMDRAIAAADLAEDHKATAEVAELATAANAVTADSFVAASQAAQAAAEASQVATEATATAAAVSALSAATVVAETPLQATRFKDVSSGGSAEAFHTFKLPFIRQTIVINLEATFSASGTPVFSLKNDSDVELTWDYVIYTYGTGLGTPVVGGAGISFAAGTEFRATLYVDSGVGPSNDKVVVWGTFGADPAVAAGGVVFGKASISGRVAQWGLKVGGGPTINVNSSVRSNSLRHALTGI